MPVSAHRVAAGINKSTHFNQIKYGRFRNLFAESEAAAFSKSPFALAASAKHQVPRLCREALRGTPALPAESLGRRGVFATGTSGLIWSSG
jgi:hypothetical protein